MLYACCNFQNFHNFRTSIWVYNNVFLYQIHISNTIKRFLQLQVADSIFFKKKIFGAPTIFSRENFCDHRWFRFGTVPIISCRWDLGSRWRISLWFEAIALLSVCHALPGFVCRLPSLSRMWSVAWLWHSIRRWRIVSCWPQALHVPSAWHLMTCK